MFTGKDEAELKFWVHHLPEEGWLKNLYLRYLSAWKINPADDLGDVLEVGTGPLCGFLPLVTARRKVALDPLFDHYRKSGLVRNDKGIELVNGVVEKMDETSISGAVFDAVLSANALDHGDSDFSSFAQIAKALKPGGRLYLHVHLRGKNQLNFEHDHSLSLEQLEEYEKKAGMAPLWKTVGLDPIQIPPGPYVALVGCWSRTA